MCFIDDGLVVWDGMGWVEGRCGWNLDRMNKFVSLYLVALDQKD